MDRSLPPLVIIVKCVWTTIAITVSNVRLYMCPCIRFAPMGWSGWGNPNEMGVWSGCFLPKLESQNSLNSTTYLMKNPNCAFCTFSHTKTVFVGTLVTLHGSDFEVDEPPKIKIGSNDCLMNLLWALFSAYTVLLLFIIWF